jgi:hypothetical protein
MILKINNIIQLVFVMVMQCLFYAAGNEFLNIVQMNFKLQKVKILFSSVKLRTAMHNAQQQNNQSCIYEISIRTSQPLRSILPSSLVQPSSVLILSLGNWLKCLLQIISHPCNLYSLHSVKDCISQSHKTTHKITV